MEKYKITVSDPWDFNGPAGPNLIMGEIIKVLSSQAIIFRSDHLLDFNGQSSDLLILKSRYKDQSLVEGKTYKGTVGAGLLLLKDYEDRDERFLEENSEYVLIGSLEKKQ